MSEIIEILRQYHEQRHHPFLNIDRLLESVDPEYNGGACTYRGERHSTYSYIATKYGKVYADLLMGSPNLAFDVLAEGIE